jgi:hypothetical protein
MIILSSFINILKSFYFTQMGYRDGITEGQKDSAQEGFNVGFKQSVNVGYKWGLVRGVTRLEFDFDNERFLLWLFSSNTHFTFFPCFVSFMQCTG